MNVIFLLMNLLIDDSPIHFIDKDGYFSFTIVKSNIVYIQFPK